MIQREEGGEGIRDEAVRGGEVISHGVGSSCDHQEWQVV